MKNKLKTKLVVGILFFLLTFINMILFGINIQESIATNADETAKSTTRTLTGNVWIVTNQENLIPVYEDGKGIEGILVELVELKDGKYITKAKTWTDNKGEYIIKDFEPGEYTVRFTYNGINYQSAKANPNTDKDKYWYNIDINTRYSDAYDEGKARAVITNAIGNEEIIGDYTYKDIMNNVNNKVFPKKMYAYTSTIVVNEETTKIENVDFGLVEYLSADIELSEYVSNIKIYLQDGTIQLDANIDKDGRVTYLNDKKYNNIVNIFAQTNTYKDGLIEALIDEELLNGATLEITYTIIATNTGASELERLLIGLDNVLIINYYDEDLDTLPFYESDRGENMYLWHDTSRETYLVEQKGNEILGEILSTRINISKLVDYIDPRFSFIKSTKDGNAVNKDWAIAGIESFESSRNNNEKLIGKYNTVVIATNDNKIYSELKAGETASTTLTLSTVLSTSSTDTSNWEYSNLTEITRIHSVNGKIKIQGYDITESETSKVMSKEEIEASDNIYPTLGTAKSETLVIHAPTGQNNIEKILSNTVIVLISFTVLAGGIVLIKKFVLKDKND